MYASTDQTAGLPAQLSAYKRRAVLLVASLCALFIISTTLYCYVYALYLDSNPPAYSLWDTFRCVSIDWLAWALIAPLLANRAVKEDISTKAGVAAIVRLLIMAALALGAARVSIEYLLNGDALVPTLVYFVPRYLFVTASFIGAGVFYVFKYSASLEIQRLKNQQISSTADSKSESAPADAERSEYFVVSKGNCRAVIQCRDIVCITACGNYLELETPHGIYLMRNTMKAVAARLDSRRFVRIHRSHIVSLAQIDTISHMRLEATLTNGKVVKIGKKYANCLPHFASSTGERRLELR